MARTLWSDRRSIRSSRQLLLDTLGNRLCRKASRIEKDLARSRS
jgi:hypothetical protein